MYCYHKIATGMRTSRTPKKLAIKPRGQHIENIEEVIGEYFERKETLNEVTKLHTKGYDIFDVYVVAKDKLMNFIKKQGAQGIKYSPNDYFREHIETTKTRAT